MNHSDLHQQALHTDHFFDDPYPFYKTLRAHGHPFWLPHTQGTHSAGIWLFSRYADAVEIFKKTSEITKNLRDARAREEGSPFDQGMLFQDGEKHLRLRRLVSDYFSTQSVERLRAIAVSVTQSILQKLKGREAFDLVAELAEPLPLTLIATIIGVPQADMAKVRRWSLALSPGFDSAIQDPQKNARHQETMHAFIHYVRDLVEAKRASPDGSLISELIKVEGVMLDPDELVGMLSFLLFAGHETVVSLIGNAAWLLLSHPEQYALLARQPELIGSTIEEVLRLESPEQRTSFRVLTESFNIGSHRIEQGQQIGVIIGSVNRDESVFDRADTFDITRTPNNHLAFGAGIHNCLGKTLARLEAQVAMALMMDTFPCLQLREAQPSWRQNSFFRGLNRLYVKQC